MADPNVIQAKTSLDVSGLQSGMAQADAIVANGAAQIQASMAQATTGTAAFTAATAAMAQSNIAAARSLQAVGQAAQGSGFSIRYAFLGIKDIAEGRYTFALAEIANELSRMGPAAIVAGAAVAGLGVAIYTISQLNFDPLVMSAKELAEATKKNDEEFVKLGKEFEHLNVELITAQFGKLAGLKLKGFYSDLDAAQDRDKIKKLDGDIEHLESKIRSGGFQNPLPGLLGQFFSKKDTDAAKNTIEELNREIDDSVQRLANHTKQSQIDAADAAKEALAEQKRVYSEAESAARKADADALEDLRARRATFEEQRALLRSEIAEQAQYTDVVRTLKAELRRVNDESGRHAEQVIRGYEEGVKKTEEAHKKELDEQKRFTTEMDRIIDEYENKQDEQNARIAEIRSRAQTEIAETSKKGAGESADLAIQQQKFELEQKYAQLVFHTHAQEVAELKAIAQLDEKAREAKIAGLAAEEATAKAARDTAAAAGLRNIGTAQAVKDAEDEVAAMKKIAALQQQINQLTQQNVNAGIQATTKAITLQEQQYQQFFTRLQTGFTHAFTSMVTAQKNWQKQWADLWNQSVTFVLDSVFKTILEKYILTNTLMAAAQQELNTILTALHLGFLVATKATDSVSAATQIATAAAIAAANAFASTAAIPIVGLALAPAAAATAYAEVMALQPAGQFHDGTDYVPRTGSYVLEKGERVTPAAFNPASGAGGSSGGSPQFHYHAAPNATAADRQQDMESSFRQFKVMARQFNR